MKSFKVLLLLVFFIVLHSCKNNNDDSKERKTVETELAVQVQGHRGDRGNFPENTIPAFKSAVKKGVDVLELDVVISGDSNVVVSHEPYMSSLYMNTPSGDSIRKAEEVTYNIYQMTYDSIRKFDAGSRGNRLFPEQVKMKTYKPLLSEVIDSVETFIAAQGLQPVLYNIELKSVEAEYGEYQPYPEEFVDLAMEVISEKGMEDKVIIQSFDPNILEVMNKNYPQIALAYLVSNEGIAKNLALLNFRPEIYSPNFWLVRDEAFVDSVKSMEMQLIPWTVNEEKDIERMTDLKVDGIITDYPERVMEMKR